jgi:hypothetical protein
MQQTQAKQGVEKSRSHKSLFKYIFRYKCIACAHVYIFKYLKSSFAQIGFPLAISKKHIFSPSLMPTKKSEHKDEIIVHKTKNKIETGKVPYASFKSKYSLLFEI